MITYAVMDVEKREVIGLVEATNQKEALEITEKEFNSDEWNSRFPFEAIVGRELAIRPDSDIDPYFTDHNATLINDIKTYRQKGV